MNRGFCSEMGCHYPHQVEWRRLTSGDAMVTRTVMFCPGPDERTKKETAKETTVEK